VFQLEPIEPADLETVLRRALSDEERGMGKHPVDADDDALSHLAVTADGDARKCLNSLEIAVLTTPPGPDGRIKLTRAVAEESIQRKAVVYDADGDQHYDTISAFIKSMRGSDPDAALYWLAKMLYAGEDIRFIARRIVICASEDVGMADSQALVVAIAAQQAVEFVGMPEARIPLAHATVYIATAPKSNRACVAIDKALSEVKQGVTLSVPRHLRDSSHKTAAKTLGHQGYKYSHDSPEAYIPQAYLPEGRLYYEPGEQGAEKRVKERLDYWRALFEKSEAAKK
jgi:putative ATPase